MNPIRHALVRDPGPEASDGLTSQSGPPLHFDRLKRQHAAYCSLLANLGVNLIRLGPLPGFPDAYFVEDTAVVTPEIAVVARPGAPQRQGEEPSVARALASHRELKAIQSPGTLDGGDVMVVGRRVFVGLSQRTNASGADQLARMLEPFGYRCTPVRVDDGLHLKSSVNSIGDDCLLIIADWVARPEFEGYRKLPVVPEEAHACNTLALNDHLVMPEGYPRTQALLEAAGHPLLTLDTSQIRRMDGGLTCLSVRF
jgi:dimethylargininase